jgi:hypothetical protein
MGIKRRLDALEKASSAPEDINCASQVVIYNSITGEPLTPPDEKAARQIWIPDDGRGLQRNSR